MLVVKFHHWIGCECESTMMDNSKWVLWQTQGSHRLESTFLNLEGFLEKSLKIKSALKSTGKPLKSLEKSLNSTIFSRPIICSRRQCKILQFFQKYHIRHDIS